MLYCGERIGDGSPPEVDIAVDPLDGTTLTAQGRSGAIAVSNQDCAAVCLEPDIQETCDLESIACWLLAAANTV